MAGRTGGIADAVAAEEYCDAEVGGGGGARVAVISCEADAGTECCWTRCE